MKGSVKIVAVVLVIAVVASVLLAVLNDVLYVPESEIEAAKLKKVYDASPVDESKTIKDMSAVVVNGEALAERYYKTDTGEVTAYYTCEDGMVIIRATGNGGYSGGWVETYTAINVDGVIHKVVVSGNKNQSFISSIKQSWLDGQFAGKNVADFAEGGFIMNSNVSPASGATASSNATINSVNMAVKFYDAAVAGNVESGPEKDPETAALEKVYGKSEIVEKVYDISTLGVSKEFYKTDGKSEITAVYTCEDGTVIIRAKGLSNYKDGFVETYTAISAEGRIIKVVIGESKEQSYISWLTQEWLDGQFAGKTVADFSDGFVVDKDIAPVVGATTSSTTAINSVSQTVIFYQALTQVK